MQVKDHYEKHLAKHYAWMVDNFDQKSSEFQQFLISNQIGPVQSGIAIDLGAGNGIQSLALKKMGYEVVAVDFNEQLLKELRSHKFGQSIRTITNDIRDASSFKKMNPELIVCCGDTLTHLEDRTEIVDFISAYAEVLTSGGRLVLSFRDYTCELTDEKRFIPVRSDEKRIMTCFLEYGPDKVRVTDLIHQRAKEEWEQKVSSYYKVRISPEDVAELVRNSGLQITFNKAIQGMHHLVAHK